MIIVKIKSWSKFVTPKAAQSEPHCGLCQNYGAHCLRSCSVLPLVFIHQRFKISSKGRSQRIHKPHKYFCEASTWQMLTQRGHHLHKKHTMRPYCLLYDIRAFLISVFQSTPHIFVLCPQSRDFLQTSLKYWYCPSMELEFGSFYKLYPIISCLNLLPPR